LKCNEIKIFVISSKTFLWYTSIRLATGWTVRGWNPGGGEIFRTCPDRPWGPPSLLYNGYRVFPGGKERSGNDAEPSPPSSAVGHERVELYHFSPYGPYGLYRASVELYIYSPYGPYGLYRASVELYLYSPYGPYGLYRASVELYLPLLPLWAVRPVQSLSRAIPLLPLWAVRPVQSLSACTRVHFTFTLQYCFVLFNTQLFNVQLLSTMVHPKQIPWNFETYCKFQ
jgi:hypothetical protein